MDVRLPDGTLLRNVPDGMSKVDLTAKLAFNGYDIGKLGAPAAEPKASVSIEAAPAQESNFIPKSIEEAKAQLRQDPIIQVGAGLYKGFKDITDTGMKLAASAVDYVLPKAPSEMTRREKINALADIQDKQYQATYGESMVAPSARIVGNALATYPVGGAIAAPIKAIGNAIPAVARFTAPVAESIASGGFRTGLPTATTLGEKAIETGVKAVGGATLGGASAAAVNPEDASTGAIVGAAIPTVAAPVVKGLAKVGGKLYDLATGQLPTVHAGKLAREMAGEQINAIRAANGAAPLDITAAQATYNIDNDVWQAFNDVIQGKDKKAVFSTLKTKQAQEQFDILANLAGGANQAEARGSREATNKLLNQVTTPMREQNLLAANGLNPLNINGVTGKLRSLATAPGTRADPVQVKVLTSVEQQIKDLAERNGGVIDANDLYQIRKTGINDAIEKQLTSEGLDPKTQSKRIADMLGQVRPLVDDAIEAAGGKGWRDYLSTHAAGMRQIEQKDLAATAMEMYKRSPKDFIELIKGNNIKAIEEIFGPGNYDIAKAMGDKMVKLQKVAGEVERDVIDIPKRIAAGRKALEITEPSVSGKIPGFVGYKTALAKKFVQIAEGKVNQKTMDALIKGAENGKNMNDLLNTLPAEERVKVLKVLSNSKEWNAWVTRAAGAAATEPVNNLAPSEQNQNALAR